MNRQTEPKIFCSDNPPKIDPVPKKWPKNYISTQRLSNYISTQRLSLPKDYHYGHMKKIKK